MKILVDVSVRRSLVDQVAYVLGDRYRGGLVLIGKPSGFELVEELGVVVGRRVGGGSAYAGAAKVVMMATPISISSRFMTTKSSKIATGALPAPEYFRRHPTHVQPVFTAM